MANLLQSMGYLCLGPVIADHLVKLVHDLLANGTCQMMVVMVVMMVMVMMPKGTQLCQLIINGINVNLLNKVDLFG